MGQEADAVMVRDIMGIKRSWFAWLDPVDSIPVFSFSPPIRKPRRKKRKPGYRQSQWCNKRGNRMNIFKTTRYVECNSCHLRVGPIEGSKEVDGWLVVIKHVQGDTDISDYCPKCRHKYEQNESCCGKARTR